MKPWIASLAMLLAGCATPAPYWTKTHPSAPPPRIKTVSPEIVLRMCAGATELACYDRQAGVIWVSADIPVALILCIMQHERKHAEGWSHDNNRPPFIDCGDGTWLSAETYRRAS